MQKRINENTISFLLVNLKIEYLSIIVKIIDNVKAFLLEHLLLKKKQTMKKMNWRNKIK